MSVLVGVPREEAFRVFTEEIDRWWRRGRKFRVSGAGRGIMRLEPRVGGRLLEAVETEGGERLVETGRVTAWEPPRRLAFDWRTVKFAPDEKTEVEVVFAPSPSGTLVTVTHRGWSAIRPDHPVRHGQETAAFLRVLGMWWSDQMTSLRECARPAPPVDSKRRTERRKP